MALHLNISPASSLPFGNVPVSGSAVLNINTSCSGGLTGDTVSWTWSITGPDAADFSPSSNAGTETQGDPVTHNPVTFSPSSPGAKSATLTITWGLPGSPRTIALSGTGAAGGSLTLSPQTTNDFGPVKDGTPSSVLNVLLQNNSGTDVIVTAINFNGDFAAGGALPAVPFTQHANHTDPVVVIPVIFTPSVTGFRITANAVSVPNNGTPNPALQSMQGTGVVINPAFTVAATPKVLLLGYVDNITPTILQADPTDLDTEEAAFVTSVYDYDLPLYEKYLNRHILRAEDFGLFDYTVSMITPRQTVTINKVSQGGLADGSVANYFADGGVSDDLITVEISRAADDGPLSITQIFHEVEKRGEQVEGT